jgi:hypothetical protein
MSNLNILKKTLIILIVLPLWVSSHDKKKDDVSFSVNFDDNSLDLGDMQSSTSLGFNVQCISDKKGKKEKKVSECGSYTLSLSSQNDYRLIHNVNPGYSIAYGATIITPGILTEDEKTYTSQILVEPGYFTITQRAGIYADTLTLSLSAD